MKETIHICNIRTQKQDNLKSGGPVALKKYLHFEDTFTDEFGFT